MLYGPGTDGDNARNNLKKLFQQLGITAWPVNKKNLINLSLLAVLDTYIE
jgi:hypothetical protein